MPRTISQSIFGERGQEDIIQIQRTIEERRLQGGGIVQTSSFIPETMTR